MQTLGAIHRSLPLSGGTSDEPKRKATVCRPVVIVVVSDTFYQQGQGQHGSFGRADTFNFMAAVGPDFKRRFVDPAPVSNADLGRTLGEILGLRIKPHGKLLGRVIREAMPGGATPRFSARTLVSEQAPTVCQQSSITKLWAIQNISMQPASLAARWD